jgi:hypothetical protein
MKAEIICYKPYSNRNPLIFLINRLEANVKVKELSKESSKGLPGQGAKANSFGLNCDPGWGSIQLGCVSQHTSLYWIVIPNLFRDLIINHLKILNQVQDDLEPSCDTPP